MYNRRRPSSKGWHLSFTRSSCDFSRHEANLKRKKGSRASSKPSPIQAKNEKNRTTYI